MTLRERVAEYRQEANQAMERVCLLEKMLAAAREEAYEAIVQCEEAEAMLEVE